MANTKWPQRIALRPMGLLRLGKTGCVAWATLPFGLGDNQIGLWWPTTIFNNRSVKSTCEVAQSHNDRLVHCGVRK